MQTLYVELGERRYPIFIGSDLDPQALLAPYIHGKQVMIVSNTTIAPLYLQRYQTAIEALDKRVAACILPDGEKYKDSQHLNLIFDALLEAGFNRDCTVLALGGGVIGDMAGFASACFQRGVYFIQVPTTLLSQVDSSVGGKTAVNHPLGKNMIGAFHQPKCVVIDTQTLNTLPEREFAAGMAEVIKYGLISDADFISELESTALSISAKTPAALERIIHHCCQMKADIVAEDEKEQGCRALLNLGHTFGHAVEAHMGYGVWLHGEAVALGLLQAYELASSRGWVSVQDVKRVRNLLEEFNLPTTKPEQMTFDDFMTHMKKDKKNLKGSVRFILPRAFAHCELVADVTEHELRALLAD